VFHVAWFSRIDLVAGRPPLRLCKNYSAFEKVTDLSVGHIEDNPVRVIVALVDTPDLKALGFYRVQNAPTGRPPYDPADLYH
jgi:hypothetical protein